ncbi:MAG: hypothetical protein U0354_11685 [Candidatus Sericytochromatia bacterium]
MINWIDIVEKTTVESLCFLENKTPNEIVSEPILKAKLIKMMSEIVRVGHFINIDFPENFINQNLKKASIITDKLEFNVTKYINDLDYIIKLGNDKKISINQNIQILNMLKQKIEQSK